ncbi:type VI secretion system membrane subunit TssM [Acetobacteraceae bacterium]|nr:type VI secretion system membrane subunit TssM [Acetobacteraceae bacterium]
MTSFAQKIKFYLSLKPVKISLITLLIAILLWFTLPFFSYFTPLLRRFLFITFIVICVFLSFLLFHLFQQKKEKKLTESLLDEDEAQIKHNKIIEIEELKQREKFKKAISLLKQRGIKSLYDLPWFILIGPPGVGKTTFLQQSSLNFPLEEDGEEGFQGVGGTRMCDWWFSDEAVLIDTAGRYTTQDSDTSVDHAGWFAFLKGLKKVRNRQPINGLIVMLSLEDLLSDSKEITLQHAKQIRKRIEEIVNTLNVNIPIYVIFNKSDKITGFEEFFNDLNAENRKQVWGMTFPLEKGKQDFQTEYNLLLEALYARQLDRMQSERGLDHRAEIYSFPTEMSGLSSILDSFLKMSLGPLSQQDNVLWRGIYFTSATQTGSPFDQLSGALLKTFGIEQTSQKQKHKSSYTRAYFIFNLTKDIILGEALLGSYTPKYYQKRKLIRLLSLISFGIIAAITSLWIWKGEYASHQSIKTQLDQFAKYHDTVIPVIKPKVTSDDDLPQICEILNKSKELSQAQRRFLSVFNKKTNRIETETANTVYENSLQKIFFPRLLWRIEEEIRLHPRDPISLYDSVRTYLILGGAGPHKPKFVQSWFFSQWQRQYPGMLNSDLRNCLNEHLSALQATSLPDAELDSGLIAQARVAFSHISPAERIYANLRQQEAPTSLQGWNLEDVFEKNGTDIAPVLFKVNKVAALSQDIPPFFTGDGFNKLLRKNLPIVAKEIAEERWITGQATDVSLPNNILSLEKEVGELWLAEATQKWDDLLNNIHLRLSTDKNALTNQLYLLSSTPSPLMEVISSIAKAQKISDLSAIEKLPTEPLEEIKQRWNTSRTPGENAPPMMETLNKQIAELSELVSSEDTSSLTNEQLAVPIKHLKLESLRFPKPVSTWMQELSNTAHQALYNKEVKAVKKDFNREASGLGQACHQIIQNRFPFTAQSDKDIPLQDFSRLFAPNGLMDKYFQDHMAQYVNQNGIHWTLKDGGTFKPPYNQSQITSFELVSKIRNAFFQDGSSPSFKANISFKGSSKVVLRLGSLTLKSGEQALVSWPDLDKSTYGFFLKSKIKKEDTSSINNGAWALFRLFSSGEIQSEDTEGVTYRFLAGETLKINKQDIKETLSAIHHFQCPKIN